MAEPTGPLRGNAFGDFYARHADPMVIWFTRRTLDAETALDLAAETFAQAYLSRRRFRGKGEREAAAWLYAIARHQLSRYYRRGKSERRALNRLKADLPDLTPVEAARIEELAELDSLRNELHKAVGRLSAEQREAILLRIVDELPYSEVADRLGTSQEAARARVSRGLRLLQNFLSPNETLDPKAVK